MNISPSTWILLAFLGIALLLLASEHRVHAFGWLVHLLLGVCVLLLYLGSRLQDKPADKTKKVHS